MPADFHARCVRRSFGEVAAQPDLAPWPELERLTLRDTVTGAPPQQSTTVQIGWTATEWRVLFHCADTHAWATHTERDAPLYEEEVVEVFFDPFGDLAAYFEIEVNPLNAVLDLALRRTRSGFKSDRAWQCEKISTAVQRTETSWTAEVAIPFASVTAEAPVVGAKWRANFYRIDRPTGVPRELSAWSPTARPSFHTPERFGVVEFVAG